jgi:predicted  nucleic acid-binding Zn-ribbon protein
MVDIEELERRVRTVEEEANGEKHLTRYAVEQTQRNGEVLHALRGDVAMLRSDVATVRVEVSAGTVRTDSLTGDMAAVKSALVMHGRALDVLQQDVRQLRGGQEELRQSQEGLRHSQEELRLGQEAIISRLDRMEGNIAAILAAVVPISPPQA